MKEKMVAFFKKIAKFITENKLLVTLIALVLVAAIIALSISLAGKPDKPVDTPTPSVPVSSEQSSSETPSDTPVVKPISMDELYKQYNEKMDMDKNPFMDSLEYTGYNLAKHRADGEMWNYVLASTKKGRGWLSKISYDYDGGTTGYEVNEEGKPDIEFFEKNDMVCATYISYVYFNYMGNFMGIDVSNIEKPEKPELANSWYHTAKRWVEAGYSKQITYDAKIVSERIVFKEHEEIPIGSLIFFKSRYEDIRPGESTHVAIYAGYKNGNHWVYHVGNDNGPEFCSIQRMCCNSVPGARDGQFMMGVFTTPTYIAQGILDKMGE